MPESDRDAIAPASDTKREAQKPQDGRTGFTGSRWSRMSIVDPDTQRIYSKTKQPLINYFAVFNRSDRAKCPTAVQDKPILSMLKAVIAEPSAPKEIATPWNESTDTRPRFEQPR